MEVELFDNERVDDLQYKGLRIIQKRDAFRFGIDAVLLANFADVKKNDRVIDLGTGTGIVAILIAGKTEAGHVTGLEIQEEIAGMASRSVRMNELDSKVSIIAGDLKNSLEYFSAASFDVVVTNPPYMNFGGGILNPSDTKAISRHEVMCTLEDVIRASSKLLKPGGQFVMVHRPARLIDIACLMRKYGIEPKFMRFVHPLPNKKPNLLLVKGFRGGRPQLKIMDPLYVYDETGNYTREINEIYGRDIKTDYE